MINPIALAALTSIFFSEYDAWWPKTPTQFGKVVRHGPEILDRDFYRSWRQRSGERIPICQVIVTSYIGSVPQIVAASSNRDFRAAERDYLPHVGSVNQTTIRNTE